MNAWQVWTATLALVALLGPPGPPAARAGDFDGSKSFLCAVATVIDCDGSGECGRQTAEAAGAPTFLRIDVPARSIEADSGRKTPLVATAHVDGRLILHGGERGRAWSATIDDRSGHMAVAVVDRDHTFSLFGACTMP